MIAPSPPISVSTVGDAPISTATTLFRHRGSLHVALIIKARFAFTPEGPATIQPAPAVIRHDRHYGRSAHRSVGAADDLAPRLPRAQITVVGHAYAPPGELLLAGSVRLVVARKEPVLDKILHVFGDSIEGSRQPFQKVRLAYERAAFSDDNPVGIPPASGSPNLVDPAHPENPAAFGPISRYWRKRRELLGTLDRGELDRAIPDLPEDFDWSYFHAAPADQRVDVLFGDEWIVLDGMHPVLPRVEFRLPSAAAAARITLAGEGTTAVELVLDTLAIDADLQLFDLVWRGSHPLSIEEADLGRVSIVASLALPGLPVVWSGSDVAPFPGAPIPGAPIPGAPGPSPPSSPRFNAPPLEAPEPPKAPLPPVPAAIPARTRPAIPIVNLSRTTAVTIPWQVRPPQSSLTLLVKGTFDLVPDSAAALREESEFPMGEAHHGSGLESSVSYPSDFAVFKPRADVTLTGTAHAPSGSAPFMAVKFQFGFEENGFDRRLVVFGDRRWKSGILGDAPTDPEPFTALPLTYERAFGGRGFESNPVGTGHRGGAAAGEIARLPNVEDPAHLIMRHDETPPPAGFAPISSGWRSRRARLGTYDNRWFRTRWPYFPEDFDWGYFQSAPAAQQLAYLRGDEPFEITGVLEGRPSLRGMLPGLRMRAFAQRTAAEGGQIVELPLHLDTAHFDTDAGTVSLVWRGILEVSDEEAPELSAIVILDEALGDSPIRAEEAQARLLAAFTPLEPVTVEPEAESAPANDEEPAAAPDADEIAATARLEALLVSQEQTRIDILRNAGVPEAEINSPPPAPPPPDPQAIAASLRLAGASEDEVAGFLRTIAQGPDEPTAERESARARAVALLEASAPFEGEDFGGADLGGLDFSGATLAGVLFDRANLEGSRFTGADLRGAQLGFANLTATNFDGANLEDADLTSATLTGASFVGACLAGADLSSVSAALAIFRGATGDRPSFAGGDFTRADFTEASLPSADFTAATIEGAVFERMIAPEITLFDAVGADAIFNDASIPGARADGVRLTGASLRRVKAPHSIWEGAMLDRSTFFGAELEGASFNRASCAGTIFSAADLDSAYFLRARLGEAQFLKADAMMASFRGSDLTRADLRGSNLHAADTYGARVADADYDLAIVTQSLLPRAR